MLGIAVRQHRRRQDVLLAGARRQAGRRTRALDVENHGRHFGVVAEAGELRHERHARARRRRHRPRPHPSGADHHAERGNLVLRLDHRVGRLPRLRILPVLLQVIDQRFAQRRRGRDRIPADEGDARHHAADRGGGVAFDQDHVLRLAFHRLDDEGIALREAGLGEVEAGLERVHVQLDRLELLAHLLPQRLLHLPHVDRQQPREHAVVNHVAHEAAQLGVVGDRGNQLVERDRIENQVVAQLVQLQRLVVDHGGARRERQHVLFRRLGVQRDEEVDLLLPGDVALRCWRGPCTTWAARRCSTGTCSCRRRARPSGRWSAAARGWRSGFRIR